MIARLASGLSRSLGFPHCPTRRLLQIGVNNTELWNNLGLCCFYASQYDMSLHCFEKALALAEDDNMADVWYNIGQVGPQLHLGCGLPTSASQAYRRGKK